MVDEYCHFGCKNKEEPTVRFTKNTDVSNFKEGEYKIIYLHFKR